MKLADPWASTPGWRLRSRLPGSIWSVLPTGSDLVVTTGRICMCPERVILPLNIWPVGSGPASLMLKLSISTSNLQSQSAADFAEPIGLVMSVTVRKPRSLSVDAQDQDGAVYGRSLCSSSDLKSFPDNAQVSPSTRLDFHKPATYVSSVFA